MLTTEEFVSFTTSDFKCTTKSEFSLNIAKYKQFVNQTNESMENDKACLNKLKKGFKIIYNSGTGHSQNEYLFCELVEKLGQSNDGDFDVDGDKVATGLCKFSVVMRDLSSKYKQLMQNLSSLVVYPLDMFLKGDIKNDAKKPFEKSIKDYEAKAEKLKKDRLNALNKENASTIYKPNGDDPFDFSEDLERERRIIQIQLCEFLMKVNEIKSRKGAELVQQLIDYYRAQTNYFKDSLLMMEHMGMFMNDLVQHIDDIKNRHSDENKLLANTRRELRSMIEKNTKQVVPGAQIGYSLHQPQGNKAYGTSKEGWLLKKSDGMVKRVWQKRRVKLSDQSMMLYHGDDNKAPVILPMLTCHIKHPIGGDSDSLCFDLISNNRTYNFRTDDEKSLEEWLSVLSNAKTAVFEQAMSLEPNDDDSFKQSTHSLFGPHCTNTNLNSNFIYNPMISSTISFKNDAGYSPSHSRKMLMKTIRKLSGNDKCVDCGGIDPEWVSVNLGVLICLECCGVHRELGVHYSRTQSLRMDTFYSSQLLLPRFVGNTLFNDVYEASLLDEVKPPPSDAVHRSDSAVIMQQRRSFIRSKYIDRKFVNCLNKDDKSRLKHDLLLAIQNTCIKDLLQVYGEGVDLMTQFTSDDDPVWGSQLYSGIHLALLLSEQSKEQSNQRQLGTYEINWEQNCNPKTSTSLLTIIEFILQNAPSAHLKRVNFKGDTILHQAVKSNQSDVIKVILRAGVICSDLMSCKNNDKQTAVELAESLSRQDLVDLIQQTSSESDKDHMNEILDDFAIDWGYSTDYFTSIERDNKIPSPVQLCKKPRKDYHHIRSESTGSNQSDASCINFNHNTVVSNETTSAHYKKEPKIGYKSMFSLNADDKIGIKSSSYPWNEPTLPRKKSLKGPAPEPPALRYSESLNQGSGNYAVATKATKANSVSKLKPEVAPKPKMTDMRINSKQPAPLPKARIRSSSNANGSYSNATLPRNMHSSHKSILPLNSTFSPLKEPVNTEEDYHPSSNSNLQNSIHLSHSSDHIDVLLDVLEEPKKPLNAKEVIHITQSPEKISANIGETSDALSIGIRTSAKFDCEAENRDELSFRRGDVIVVKNRSCEDGWWEGFLEDEPSRSGMFPANFVQRLY